MSIYEPDTRELAAFVGVNTLLTIMICAQFFGSGLVLAWLVSWVQ